MKFYSPLAILILLFQLGVYGQSTDKSATLFSINKRAVSTNEFIYLYKKNHKNEENGFSKEKIEEYLSLYIKFKLKVEEARQRGMDTTQKFKKEFYGYKEAIRKPYLPDSKLIDSLSLLTYNRLKEEIKAAHILIKVAEDAIPADTLAAFQKISNIKKRIDSGEDFGSLALRLSEDPSAKSNEGNLGYFTALQMVYPFEAKAFSTPVGQVSNPVRTRFGYHLIKVADRRLARGEVEVSHILVRTGKDRDSDKAKQVAQEIYANLQRDAKWEELCKQFSEDQSTKDNAGKLRPFGVGVMASVPEFERVAFSLNKPGEIAEPFATQYGWHLVRLEKKIPLPDYKEMEEQLKTRVGRDERMQTAKAAIQKNLRSKYQYVENSKVKEEVLALADTSLQQGKWKRPAVFSNKQILFQLGNSSRVASDFFDYVEVNQKPTKQASLGYFTLLYENFVNASIEEEVEKNLIKNNEEYRYLSNEYYEGILLFDIMEKEVWNRASEDTTGQYLYYKANTSKYSVGERAEAIIYSTNKKEVLQELKKLILADSVITTDFIKKKSIRLERGKFEKEERPVLAVITWAAGIYEAELEGNYYLVKVQQILPVGTRSFEEAKGLLVADYQFILENDWIEMLRKKYPIKESKKAKSYVYKKLAAQK